MEMAGNSITDMYLYPRINQKKFLLLFSHGVSLGFEEKSYPCHLLYIFP